MTSLYIQLGKLGDILNILPMLAMEAKREPQQSKPRLMVAEEFASVLEGVSYVEPVIFKGHYAEVGRACEEARLLAEEWKCTQVNCSTEQVVKYVYGPANQKSAITQSFQIESWKVAGMVEDWPEQPPLFFDNRDQRRESKLVETWAPSRSKRKTILVSAGGTSSPFEQAAVLRELVKGKFSDKKRWNVVDLAEVKAERFYDLLGIYDEAYCLIATDSAPLHLARACPCLRVLAFTSDKPILWNGSPWRPNHVFYCRYSDFSKRVSEFMAALDRLDSNEFNLTSPLINHVWSAYYEPGQYFQAPLVPPWIRTPITIGMLGRDTINTIQDDQRHPFLKDCLSIGMQRVSDEDFVCLTRPDTQFEPGAFKEILEHDASFAYRLQFESPKSTFWPVADMFAARKDWWRQRLKEIPPMVLGRDHYWPHVLAALFTMHGAKDVTGIVFRQK